MDKKATWSSLLLIFCFQSSWSGLKHNKCSKNSVMESTVFLLSPGLKFKTATLSLSRSSRQSHTLILMMHYGGLSVQLRQRQEGLHWGKHLTMDWMLTSCLCSTLLHSVTLLSTQLKASTSLSAQLNQPQQLALGNSMSLLRLEFWKLFAARLCSAHQTSLTLSRSQCNMRLKKWGKGAAKSSPNVELIPFPLR